MNMSAQKCLFFFSPLFCFVAKIEAKVLYFAKIQLITATKFFLLLSLTSLSQTIWWPNLDVVFITFNAFKIHHAWMNIIIHIDSIRTNCDSFFTPNEMIRTHQHRLRLTTAYRPDYWPLSCMLYSVECSVGGQCLESIYCFYFIAHCLHWSMAHIMNYYVPNIWRNTHMLLAYI